jgi:hypothetical protein
MGMGEEGTCICRRAWIVSRQPGSRGEAARASSVGCSAVPCCLARGRLKRQRRKMALSVQRRAESLAGTRAEFAH